MRWQSLTFDHYSWISKLQLRTRLPQSYSTYHDSLIPMCTPLDYSLFPNISYEELPIIVHREKHGFGGSFQPRLWRRVGGVASMVPQNFGSWDSHGEMQSSVFFARKALRVSQCPLANRCFKWFIEAPRVRLPPLRLYNWNPNMRRMIEAAWLAMHPILEILRIMATLSQRQRTRKPTFQSDFDQRPAHFWDTCVHTHTVLNN